MVSDIKDGPAKVFSIGAGVSRSARTGWRCHIGRRLHQARENAHGLDIAGVPRRNRQSIALQLGFTERGIWEIENGISPPLAEDLALFGDAYGVHPGYFFDASPFQQWRAPSPGKKMPSAMLAMAIDELAETERDIVTQLVLFLSNRDRRFRPRPASGAA